MPFITYSVDDKTFHCEQRDKLVVIVLIHSCPPKSPGFPKKKKKKKKKKTKDCGITPCLDMNPPTEHGDSCMFQTMIFNAS
jgi:hypothetical protein